KASSDERDRRGETLFIDARSLGRKLTRTQIELTDDEIGTIASTYHSWRGERGAGPHADIPGFAKSATLEEIDAHHLNLTPGRYVGADVSDDDEGAPFDERVAVLLEAL